MNFFDRWSHFFFCGIILVFHDGLRSFVLSSQGFFCLQNVTSFLRFHEPFLALISHMALLISATVVFLALADCALVWSKWRLGSVRICNERSTSIKSGL